MKMKVYFKTYLFKKGSILILKEYIPLSEFKLEKYSYPKKRKGVSLGPRGHGTCSCL